MFSIKNLTILIFILIGLIGCEVKNTENGNTDMAPEPLVIERYTSLVNPFIGTGGKGKTYPGATVPFGMVQLSPDNGRSGWDWISGYFYPDSVIAGFSHTHLSGTGIGDLYDVSYFPHSGNPKIDSIGGKGTEVVYSNFSHTYEKSEPGYYAIQLLDYDIRVELTATERTGLQKYTSKNAELWVNLNLGYARNWDSTVDAKIEYINDTLIVGYRKSTGWARDQRVYFASILSETPESSIIMVNGDSINVNSASSTDIIGVLRFDNTNELLIKTGISSVSIENALLNLNTELPGWDFEATKSSASNLWEKELQKIKVKTYDDESLEKFYTALYQTMLAPTIFSDVNGEYKGADGKIHKAEGYTRYSTFSLWDTFRAEHPLLTILHPNRVSDMIQSMLAHYQEYGELPVWDLLANETDMMIGYHAVPVIADAYLKGIRGFDENMALEAMISSATQNKFGINYVSDDGIIPQDKQVESVSLALEYAFDDYCIFKMAEALGKDSIASVFEKRSTYFKNYFDGETGFMRARNSDGEFVPGFNPFEYNDHYIEGNAWQYSWFVPHDVAGLIELHGGNTPFKEKLDELYTKDSPKDDLPVFITGLIGQYVHGNEPGHHIPYLYTLAGSPEKSQKLIRKITSELHKATPAGICGNEDCGQMSAWYVFSSMGFYPVNPCGGEYIIGTPHFSEVIINNMKKFRIKAKNNPEKNYLIDSIYLNESVLTNYRIHHSDIIKGGELTFEMKDQIQKEK